LQSLLDVDIRNLLSLPVLYHACLLESTPRGVDRRIRRTFQGLRERASEYGLDPDSLLYVGIPEVVGGEAVSYTCCIEFPIPVEDAGPRGTPPGGRYAVLTVDKVPAEIKKAIRALRGDYLLENDLIVDEDRRVYEIYFKNTLEYCVPIR
jgi:DNA gyrase inhibitor GyrI